MFDVAIIGAGVVGSLAALELSKYDLKICLIDKEVEPGCGASKANSAIVHAGYDAAVGTKKAELNVLGNGMMEALCRELEVPYKKTGSLVLAFHKEDCAMLDALLERGRQNHVEGLMIIPREQILKMEPKLNPEVVSALYAPSAGMISSYELACAATENAVDNGAEIRLGFMVAEIKKEDEAFCIISENEKISARFVVNCAGVYGDAFCGLPDFAISPRRGEYLLLDKKLGGMVSHIIFQTPTKMGKGILVAPTAHGNLMLGPTSVDIKDKENAETTVDGINSIKDQINRILPEFKLNGVITSFAGIRTTPSTDDFLIEASKTTKGLINAVGIDSPGLTASPAIAVYIAKLLEDEGLIMTKKQGERIGRKEVIRFSERSVSEKNEMIKQNPAYGRIVCRCEGISEGEIIDAIRRNAGARTVDGVKRRVRAGMGRCQGGFCMPRVLEILSRELGVPETELTKSGGASQILAYDLKETKV